MDSAKLIKMANQIGDFFGAMTDRAEAIEGIASHLRKNWEPRMRRALYDHVDAHGTEGMSAIVGEAVTVRREYLEPKV